MERIRFNFFPWLLLVLFVCGTQDSAAQLFNETAKVTLRSRLEGQFIVKGVPFPPTVTPNQDGAIRTFKANTSSEWPTSVRLDPSTAIVVCDRVKQIFLQELAIADQWHGLIEVDIDFYPNGVKRPIILSHRLMTDGLHTAMKVPDEVTPHRLVQAITQVLLLELANREMHQTRMTEIPLWMIEGFTQLIMQRSGPALIPTPGAPRTFSVLSTIPTKDAKARLRTIEPPGFSYLASPGPESLKGIYWMIFQDCSLVLTCELLDSPNGRERFLNSILLLKKYLNWQTAFLKAWEGQFQSMTDVEKWWALILVSSQKDTSRNGLTVKQSLEKLNSILAEASVTTLSEINRPKRPDTIHLQQIAENWSPSVQIYFFERIAAQLKAFELAAEPSIAELASRYRITVTDYIHQPKIYAFFGKDAPSRADLRLLKRRLNYLDLERGSLQLQADQISEEGTSPYKGAGKE